MYVYLNGQFVDEKKAAISPFDYGYLYGVGVFETFRIYEGHPFLLEDHLDRLRHTLDELQIKSTFSNHYIQKQIQKLMFLNEWSNGSIRLNVSAGVGEPGLRTLEFQNPTLLIYGNALPKASETVKSKQGTILNIPRNTPEGAKRWKSHHFLNNLLAKQEIGNTNGMEGIFLTREGFIAEGITSNVFWVKDNIVYTPSIRTGILKGITRQYLLTICKKYGLQLEYGEYTKEALLRADECFVTNSIQEIVTLNNIDDHVFPRENTVTRTLYDCYKKDRNKLLTSRG